MCRVAHLLRRASRCARKVEPLPQWTSPEHALCSNPAPSKLFVSFQLELVASLLLGNRRSIRDCPSHFGNPKLQQPRRRVPVADVEVLVPRAVEEEAPGRIAAVQKDIRVLLVERDGASAGATSPRVLLRGNLSRDALRRLLSDYPSIEWLHLFSAGVENILPELGGYDGTVTNSAGLHGDPIAEWVVMMMLAHVKKLPLLLDHHRAGEWREETGEELGGKTLGIVGAGGIGGSIARRARALDMRVAGLRASGAPAEHFDAMYRPEQLHTLLGECDFVVLATPLTPETEGMIGEQELEAMRETGVLLNIARGKVVKTDTLVRALTEARIGGAYLDVTDPEPLPPEHPLWTAPNTLITAHTSAHSPRSSTRVLDFFCENLRRWCNGESLLNVVERDRGY